MNQEIEKLAIQIEMLENEKHELIKTKPNTRETDVSVSILEDEIEQTTLQYNHLLTETVDARTQLQEYQKLCEHVFIEDLIDITPDKSKTIKYCAHCFLEDKDILTSKLLLCPRRTAGTLGSGH